MRGNSLLLVVATLREISPLVPCEAHKALEKGEVVCIQSGRYNVDVLVTGVGITSTLMSLWKNREKQAWKFLLNAGIAGSMRPDLPPGRTVLVGEDYFGDAGIYLDGTFYTLSEKKLFNPDHPPYSNGILVNHAANKWSRLLNLPVVRGVTVSAMNVPFIKKSSFYTRFDPAVESMEGAAVSLFCLDAGMPFLQVRTVSNYCTDADSRDWDITGTVRKLSEAVSGIIEIIGPSLYE